MKTFPIYVLLFVSAVFNSCNKNKKHPPDTVNITALLDITDPMAIFPDAESLLSIYDFPKDKNKEAFFRLTTTTDKLLNPAIELHLPPAETTKKDNQFEDPDFREKEVLAFYEEVRKSIASFNTQKLEDTTLEHSECFRSIAGELTLMKEHKTGKCLLAVYSDLAENSDLDIVYGSGLQQLLKHPDTTLKRFETTGLLPNDLSGFTVLFIYQPKDREDDQRFNTMVRLYQKMLSKRGATVIVSADNPKYIQL